MSDFDREPRRPKYREYRNGVATKVFTTAHESKYLIVKNVPSFGNVHELLQQFALYGPIEEWRIMDEVESEKYTDTYWIKFCNIKNARFAKRKNDDLHFIGNLLNVTYAPEYETVDDTREKLMERRSLVYYKIRQHNQPAEEAPAPKSNAIPIHLHHKIPFEVPFEQPPVMPLQTIHRPDLCALQQPSTYVAVGHPLAEEKYFTSHSMNQTVDRIRGIVQQTAPPQPNIPLLPGALMESAQSEAIHLQKSQSQSQSPSQSQTQSQSQSPLHPPSTSTTVVQSTPPPTNPPTKAKRRRI